MIEEWKLGQPNKSASYLLPLVGDSFEQFSGKIFPQTLYINTFSGAEERPELIKHIFVLYRYSESAKFRSFEAKLKQIPTYVECYDPDPYHVMYVFEVPTDYLQALEKFRLGKYSEMREDIKKKILSFYKINPSIQTTNPLYGTLYKKEFQYQYLEDRFEIKIPRDMEASSLPEFSKEIYLEKYKQIQEDANMV